MGKEMAMMPADYVQWLTDIKNRVSAARHKAALAVNAELYRFTGISGGIFCSDRLRKAGAAK